MDLTDLTLLPLRPDSFLVFMLLALSSVIAAGMISTLRGINQLTVLSLLFLLSVFTGFSNQSFLTFYMAALVAISIFLPARHPGWLNRSVYPPKIVLRFVCLCVIAGIIYFKAELAEVVVFSRSAGQFAMMSLVILVHLVGSVGAVGRSLLGLSMGMMIGYLGTHPVTGAFRYPSGIEEWADGISLMVVLVGYCIFTPILEGKILREQSTLPVKQEERHSLPDLFFSICLLLFGIGPTAATVLMFGMLEESSVPYGALATLESDPAINHAIAGLFVALLLSVLLKKPVARLAERTVFTFPAWMVESVLIVVAFASILLSGLGWWSLFLAVLFGITGVLLSQWRVPISLLLVGFVYGKHLEYFLQISLMTEQDVRSNPVVIISALVAAAIILYKCIAVFKTKSRSR